MKENYIKVDDVIEVSFFGFLSDKIKCLFIDGLV